MNLSPGLIDDARLLSSVLARVRAADLRLGALARDDSEWTGAAHAAYAHRLEHLRHQALLAVDSAEVASAVAQREIAAHGF